MSDELKELREDLAKLRERSAASEEKLRAHDERLERGAGTMDELRRSIADTSRQNGQTAEELRKAISHQALELTGSMRADREQCERTFTEIRDRMAPKPWTFKRALSWAFGPGLAVLGIVGGFAIWLLALRDTTRDATRSAEEAAGAVHSLKGDMRTLERRQDDTEAALHAVSEGQATLVDRIDKVLIGRGRPKKDEEP